MSSWASSRGRIGVVADNVPRGRVIVERVAPMVSVRQTGGLGNRIIQVLTGLNYAKRVGKQFVFVEEHMAHNAHTPAKVTKDFMLELFPAVKVYRGRHGWRNTIKEAVGTHYHYNAFPDVSGSVLLEGYFQNVGYFDDMALRDGFRFPRARSGTSGTGGTRYDLSGVDLDHTYFIHFRKGDYINSEFALDLSGYYKKAVAAILAFDTAGRFLVFSDEVSKVTGDLAGFGINEDLVAGIVPVSLGIQESLWLMSSMRGGICANSTFSWIAAYACKGDGPLFIPACWSTRHPDFVFTAPWLTVVDL